MENLIVTQAKIVALRELYVDLLRDTDVPYKVCQKVKEKIVNLEKILFVDEFLATPPLSILSIE